MAQSDTTSRLLRTKLAIITRELAVLTTLAVFALVTIVSIQAVAQVEPLVAAVISSVAIVVPFASALIAASVARGDLGFARAMVRPVQHFVTVITETWPRTVTFVLLAAVLSVAVWGVGAGSLTQYPFSCDGPTSVRYTIFAQERLKSCSTAEILTVWVPPLSDPSKIQFACSGGGVTLSAYVATEQRREWICPNNRCPSDMVYVPGGYRPDLGSVRAFCLDRTEVTVGEFSSCRSCAGGEQGLTSVWPGPTATKEAIAQRTPFCTRQQFLSHHPINCVDLPSAQTFCENRQRRLPSATEWYWAASGADANDAPYRYPWGNVRDDNRICFQPQVGSCPVGGHPAGASPLGAQDLLGDVWEWTSTTSVREGQEAAVVVGGGWGNSDFPPTIEVSRPVGINAGRLNGAYWAEQSIRSNILGFRCASEPHAQLSANGGGE